MTKPGPTISARKTRQCVTCHRTLPRRAYRRECASCRKIANGRFKRIGGCYDAEGKEHIIRAWSPPGSLLSKGDM